MSDGGVVRLCEHCKRADAREFSHKHTRQRVFACNEHCAMQAFVVRHAPHYQGRACEVGSALQQQTPDLVGVKRGATDNNDEYPDDDDNDPMQAIVPPMPAALQTTLRYDASDDDDAFAPVAALKRMHSRQQQVSTAGDNDMLKLSHPEGASAGGGRRTRARPGLDDTASALERLTIDDLGALERYEQSNSNEIFTLHHAHRNIIGADDTLAAAINPLFRRYALLRVLGAGSYGLALLVQGQMRVRAGESLDTSPSLRRYVIKMQRFKDDLPLGRNISWDEVPPLLHETELRRLQNIVADKTASKAQVTQAAEALALDALRMRQFDSLEYNESLRTELMVNQLHALLAEQYPQAMRNVVLMRDWVRAWLSVPDLLRGAGIDPARHHMPNVDNKQRQQAVADEPMSRYQIMVLELAPRNTLFSLCWNWLFRQPLDVQHNFLAAIYAQIICQMCILKRLTGSYWHHGDLHASNVIMRQLDFEQQGSERTRYRWPSPHARGLPATATWMIMEVDMAHANYMVPMMADFGMTIVSYAYATDARWVAQAQFGGAAMPQNIPSSGAPASVERHELGSQENIRRMQRGRTHPSGTGIPPPDAMEFDLWKLVLSVEDALVRRRKEQEALDATLLARAGTQLNAVGVITPAAAPAGDGTTSPVHRYPLINDGSDTAYTDFAARVWRMRMAKGGWDVSADALEHALNNSPFFAHMRRGSPATADEALRALQTTTEVGFGFTSRGVALYSDRQAMLAHHATLVQPIESER